MNPNTSISVGGFKFYEVVLVLGTKQSVCTDNAEWTTAESSSK